MEIADTGCDPSAQTVSIAIAIFPRPRLLVIDSGIAGITSNVRNGVSDFARSAFLHAAARVGRSKAANPDGMPDSKELEATFEARAEKSDLSQESGWR
jgi:hypothetical protein